jgi:ATP-dependent Zn protease
VAIGQLYDKLDSDASIIQEVTIKKNTLTGKFTPNVAGTAGESNEFYVVLPNSGDLVNTLTEKLHAKGINVRVEQDSFTDILTSFALSALLPLIVMVLVWVIFFRPMQGNNNQAMSFGRAKPRRPAENSQRVTFEDVAGVEEAKQLAHGLALVIDQMQVSSRPLELERLGIRALGLARLLDPIDTDFQPHTRLNLDLQRLARTHLLFNGEFLLGRGIQVLNLDEHRYAF